MPRITRDEVERVVALARLTLSEPELDRMERDLDSILDYVDALDAVDTTDVEPTAHVIPLATPLRDDVAAAPMDPQLAVSNAPVHEGTAFVVPKVIGGEEEG